MMLLLALLFTIASSGRIVVRPAGMGGRAVLLAPNFQICPKAFSSRGFTVACEPDMTAAAVSFYVNGTYIRTEVVPPYSIAGDIFTYYRPWHAAPGQLTITCRARNFLGDEQFITVMGTFTCGYSLPIRVVTRSIRKSDCVGIPANTYKLPRPELWVPQSDGSLGYALKDNSLLPAEPSEETSLRYSFVVPTEARYGITLDSATMGDVDYNDVWIIFDGLTLRGYDNRTGLSSVYENIHGPVKAYQNFMKRSKAIFSVDHNPHTFSTTNKLKPGLVYNITIAARSTKFRLYGIMLFPCDGADCVAGTSHWQRSINMCSIWD